ncbi:hypothetical protein HY624_02965 [Candidatus Uhrbacteria bacterium]|nr:hypothetical protein [Candidatus Uhrbacteria bacterium]
MYFLFSLLTILPLLAFMNDPATYVWTPWLSLGVLLFGSFVLIPRRRFLFTIPITVLLLSAFAVFVLLDREWAKTAMLIGAMLVLWHWWHITAHNSLLSSLTPPLHDTLALMTLLFLFSASFAGNAFAIYLDEPLWKITILFFSASVILCFCDFVILLPTRRLLPAIIFSVVTMELFLVTFYLPIAFYTKSIVLTFFGSFVIDLYLRHRKQTPSFAKATEGRLTLARIRAYLIIFLVIVTTLLATAEWI